MLISVSLKLFLSFIENLSGDEDCVYLFLSLVLKGM